MINDNLNENTDTYTLLIIMSSIKYKLYSFRLF